MNDNKPIEFLTHHHLSNIDFISSEYKRCLFLDIDGTLCDFQLNPDDCFIPSKTLKILEKMILNSIPIFAVTGRDIKAAQKLFEFIDLPIAALHGLEIYFKKDKQLSLNKNKEDITEIYHLLLKKCEPYPNLLIENKDAAIALHYRKFPELEPIAKQIMIEIHQHFPELKLIHGKCVYELISAQANKGRAIQNILEYLNQTDHYSPIFIGDDLTDEDGFAYVNQIKDGISIKVGHGVTQAKYRLEDINQVYEFLALFLEHIQNHEKNMISNNKAGGEKICLN